MTINLDKPDPRKEAPGGTAAGTGSNALVAKLIALLLQGMPACVAPASRFGDDAEKQRALLRGLMNMRDPQVPLPPEFMPLQDQLLSAEQRLRPSVEPASLPPAVLNPQMRTYRGDILDLKADAVVNAANPTLLGCFIAGHHCLDNCIHSAAGLQMRYDLAAIMRRQGRVEPAGGVKVTPGYNLQCRYVLHAVGPRISWQVTPENERQLRNCYVSCLQLARERGCKSIVFPCLSTGEFRFPHSAAAAIAVAAVDAGLKAVPDGLVAVFNTYTDVDEELYRRQLDPKDPEEDRELHPFFNEKLF